MKRLLAFLSLAAMLAWALSAAVGAQAGPPSGTLRGRLPGLTANKAARQAPGEILVKYKPSLSLTTVRSIEKAAGVRPAASQPGLPGTKLLRVSQASEMESALSILRKNPTVEYAEPNHVVRALYRPNDPQFPEQWALENVGGSDDSYWGWGDGNVGPASLGFGVPDADIDATDVWNFERGMTSPVTVAVLDTGIDASHPDLTSKLWANATETAGDPGVDDDGNGYVDDIRGASTVYLSQTVGPNDIEYLGSGTPDINYSEIAQSFTVDTTTSMGSVQLLLFRYGTPGDGIRVSLRTELNGADLRYYDLAPSEVTSTTDRWWGEHAEIPSLVEKEFASPVQLVPGQNYYLVVHTDANDYENSYALFVMNRNYNAKVDPFPLGQMYRYDSTWTADRGFDLFFGTDAASGDIGDGYGHGTHVSGIIAAASGNREGVAGVSFGAKLMPVKVIDQNGLGTVAGVAKGIRYAADNGARVINMSLGFESYSQTLQDAIDYAYARGVVTVAAAGNEGWYTEEGEQSPLSYPAANEHVIAVGSTEMFDFPSEFTSHNGSVDISAPGEFIYSTTPTAAVSLTDWIGLAPNYDYLDGTSMASPHVAGVAALMISANPALTPAQVETYLRASSEDLGRAGRDDFYGSGRLNAARAVAKAIPDVSAPVAGKLLVNSGARFVNRRDVVLATPASDADSAAADMRLANSGSPWSPWRTYARAVHWRLTDGDGNKSVAVRFRDWAGNVTAAKYVSVILDRVKPRAAVFAPSRATGASFRVSWTGSDARSGVAGFDVFVRDASSGRWIRWKKSTLYKSATFRGASGHTYLFKAVAIDRAGNRGESGIAATLVP